MRIPKSFALEAHLAPDTPVELSLVDGKLVIAPATDLTVALEELLAAVTDDNRHHEVDTGPAVGTEAW